MIPKQIDLLTNLLKQIPGVGYYNAERMAFFIATSNPNYYKDLSQAIGDCSKLKKCSCCNILTEKEVCDICSDPKRDNKKLMIVSDSKDAYIIEATKCFKGKYHVLDGIIDFSKGKTEKELKIGNIYSKIDLETEIILALDGTLEGEITAKYLKSILPPKSKIKRIASGIPVGADLKYTDKQTIISAIENSKEF